MNKISDSCKKYYNFDVYCVTLFKVFKNVSLLVQMNVCNFEQVFSEICIVQVVIKKKKLHSYH